MGQSLEFTMLSPLVLLAGSWLTHHRPHMFAPVVPDKHRQQLVAIEPVRLGAPSASIDLDAGCVNDDVVDPKLAEPSV